MRFLIRVTILTLCMLATAQAQTYCPTIPDCQSGKRMCEARQSAGLTKTNCDNAYRRCIRTCTWRRGTGGRCQIPPPCTPGRG